MLVEERHWLFLQDWDCLGDGADIVGAGMQILVTASGYQGSVGPLVWGYCHGHKAP